MVDAILKEISREAYKLKDQPVETIYFGGGTPSLLTEEELDHLTEMLFRSFDVSAGAEITFEVNPDDITRESLAAWKKSGINRLSIGVQSFRDEDLAWMNRAHNSREALNGILLAREAGFNNLTIDLIYGTPGLSDKAWEENVQKAISLGVPHLSCYALTVEPKTRLEKMIRTHQAADTDPEQQSRQFLLLMDWLRAAGYEHYEISNFARPGFRSRHNSAYWQGVPYLGFGPGAHSYNGKTRSWNVANNALFMQGIEKDIPVSEEEVLTTSNRINEYIMTSLRTAEGMDMRKISDEYGDEYAKAVGDRIGKYQSSGQLIQENGVFRLTNEGKLFADGIAADLFC